MSSSKGLDQLCAAACDTALGSPLPNENPGEIKVREIEAYASVADLIHAAIVANSGAASLKEIYEVCEEHGRIAYRRADGSRLITSNDHWKSQVRHALYTGGRFERLPSNGEYWQLTTASRGSAAELVKVLVRADDDYLHVRATLELTPSAARTADVSKIAVANVGTSPGIGRDTRQAGVGSARQRRKRNGTSPTAATASIEAMCDSIDPSAAAATAPGAGAGAMRAPDCSLRQRGGRLGAGDSNAPDNHSTQDDDENFDEVRGLPRVSSRAKRVSRKPSWKVANASEDDEEAAALGGGGGGGFYRAPWAPPYQYNNNSNNQAIKHEFREDKLYNYGAQNTTATAHLHQASKDSADPSTLRWGSTCLRSTYIISATAGESSGLSAGRTPLIPGRRALGGIGRVRDTSAEADSAPMKKYRQTHAVLPSGTGNTDRDPVPPSSKRQTVGVPPHSTKGALPTPQARVEGGTAQMTPPFISQWAEAMQHHLEEAAAVAQQRKQTTAGGPSTRTAAVTAGEAAAAAMTAGWPYAGAPGAIPGLSAGLPPMVMLPAMLPGLLAAAAPFFSNQQAQQQMQQQMQAIMENTSDTVTAAAAGDGPNTEEKQ